MQIRKDKVNSELVISVRGYISEQSQEQFEQLLESDFETSFAFDLSKVQMINSIGTRAWIALTRKLKKRKFYVPYRHCSSSVIEAVNMFPDFVEKKEIESFFIPTSCSRCDHKIDEEVTPASVKEVEFEPSKDCPTCKINMTLAVDLEDYLHFLTL